MRIQSIHIYPIKGLAGISVPSARVQPRGLEYDRRFMLTDPTGKFITQRSHPELTQFETAVEQGLIRVGHRDAGSFSFPAKPKSDNALQTVIWDDTVSSTPVSKEADEYFSDALKQPIKLVGMHDSTHRQVDLTYAKPGDGVSYADGYPILVLGTASIDELNSRLDTLVPINRFRANIIVSGGAPWDEDAWKTFTTVTCRLRLVKPCARCIVIRTDQQTGIRSEEPMATLLTYRRMDKKVLVGMNAIPEQSENPMIVELGQTIEVSY